MILFFLLSGGLTYSGTVFQYYNTSVGAFNGNGYTDYQTKSIGGANGHINSYTVGGSYVVSVRMTNSNASAAWVRGVDSRQSYELPGHHKHLSNHFVRLQFSNGWVTPVSVQVTGDWRSN